MHTQYGPGDPQTWGAIRSPADPRYDEDSEVAREEAIQARAALIWEREIAEPGIPDGIRAEKLRDGITEVMGIADGEEVARLRDAAFLGTPAEFREMLIAMVRDYLAADCDERARVELELEDAIARMGY